MVGTSKLAAILCGVFGGLCVVVASPDTTLAQALLRSSVQEPSGGQQPSSLPGTPPAHAPQEQAAPVYPQTADGFKDEMASALDAYQRGDAASGRRLLERFRLLSSTEWLREFVVPEQSEALARRYDLEFESYLKYMEARLANVEGKKLNIRFNQGTQRLPDAVPVDAPLKLSGIVALKEPIRYNADFSARLTGKADLVLKGNVKFVSWEDTFVYQNGAFRFIGRGAWPFWVWKDRSDEKKPEGP